MRQLNTIVKETPYWWDEAQPEDATVASLPQRVDTVIVGAGFAGLGAAIPLARAGHRVLVVDKDQPGAGASSRNGGITSGNIRWSYSELIKRIGKDNAQAVYQEGIEARKDLANFITAEQIDCDYQPSGRFSGAMTPRGLDGMKREADLLAQDIGIPSEPVEAVDQHKEIGSRLYTGGVVRPDIGGLHPAKLHRGMRTIAEQSGAIVLGNYGVKHIEKDAEGFRVIMDRANVGASNVVIATNGYTDAGLPWLRRRLVPVISEIIATHEISDNLMSQLMPTRRMFGEARELGHYYRPSPDGRRILFGGRRYDRTPAAAQSRLKQHLTETFPELQDVGVSHHWSGYVAFPMDQLPKLTIHEGVIYAAGFCGSGVVWARWIGAQAAQLILDKDVANSAFKTDRFPAIPLYNGTPWFLSPMMGWYRIKDAWRQR